MNLKNIKIEKWMTVAFCLCSTILLSCSDQFHTIQEYLDEGEVIYASKMDSLKVRSGRNRVLVTGLLMYGMDTKECLIKWSEEDSLLVAVERINPIDEFSQFIENLEEGSYDFEIVTFDSYGNRSIVQQASAKVYGDIYQSSLRGRTVKQIVLDGTNLKVNFSSEIIESLYSTFVYENSAGNETTVKIPYGTTELTITDWKSRGKYKVYTHYLPEIDAVDTFSVSFSEGLFPEKKIIKLVDKSGFAEILLPGDINLTAWGGALWKAWNNNLGDFAHSDNTKPVPFPVWFTFDMGKEAKLYRFELYHVVRSDLIYNAGNLKRWEIWGRPDAPTDNSWEGWTKLTECSSFKPSGRPRGDNTAEDIAYFSAGEKFLFPAGLPKVRYIRIKVLETWGGVGYIHFAEFSFYEESVIE